MKIKKKTAGIKQKIREEKEREQRIALRIIIAAILITTISISGFLVNSMLNQPSTISSQPKAAIVDHLSLTFPNQTFIQTATNTLKQENYSVDYYQGEKVTVDFFRNLPARGYSLIILRVHSAAAALEGQEYVEAPVCFFTSESYSQNKYVLEQLADQLVIASYNMPEPPYYFGITPKFVTSSMNGEFCNTAIIMMGCEGLNNTEMAEAFITKGAKVYVGWNRSVSASHTDQATTYLLQQLILQNQTIKQAVENTMKEMAADPEDTQLTYYPLQAGEQTIQLKTD